MEVNHDISLEEIYIPSKHAKDTYLCEDFIIYPEGKEKNGGYLIGIVEIRATPIAESEKIIQTLINTLKDNYYDQINSSPEPQKLNLETVFEHALQKTNTALTEMIQIGHISLVLENLNFLIAVAKPNLQTKDIDFYFAQQGLINAYLLHKTKQNNFKVINVVDNTPKLKEEQGSKLKIFSSTVSGKIFYHDTIFICSEIFSNYIPPHKVNKILSSNEFGDGIEYFKSLINNVKNNSHLTYSAIFIKMQEKRSIDEKPVSQKSIARLISTKETTEKFLTPTFALNIRAHLRKFFKKSKVDKSQLAGPNKSVRLKFGILKYFFNAIKIIFTSIGKALKVIFKIITGKKKLKLFRAKESLTHPETSVVRSKDKLFSLRKLNKTILIALLIVGIILVSSIFWVKHRKQVKEEQAIYAVQIQQAKDLINDAQINLIYKNDSKSLELIKKAEDIIKYLPQATANQKANFEELEKQSVTIKNKLLNIEKIVPLLITKVGPDDIPINLLKLEKIGDKLFTHSKDLTLYEVNPEDKTSSAIGNSEHGDLAISMEEDGNLSFITNQNKLVAYSSDQKNFTNKSISWPDNAKITHAELYNRRIYALDANGQQIIKYSASGNNYGSGQIWIKDKKDADLSKATSLTIDGDIYVLTSDGKVYKFYTGELQEFDLKLIEPALAEANKIYTTAELPYIYISEAGSKRIILTNKNGDFAKQYLFESLEAPIADFVISGNKMYLISGNKVYEADIK
ncbi:hypothetical protein HQ571_00925 [Candidatus Kuenenbacteria bacterium]|nr:hypothetical protein [Candidatus Kuenenbacteria bacterium]